MPSHSEKQARVMSAIAHGWRPTGSAAGIPVGVAKEFHAADAGHKYGAGMAQGGFAPSYQDALRVLEQAGRPQQRTREAEVMADGGVAGFADGGAPWFVRQEARNLTHSGPIASTVPGRTDRHNVSVRSGAYVLPADVVSHMGQNNTAAGHSILGQMFSGGPYGTKAGKIGGSKPAFPKVNATPALRTNIGGPKIGLKPPKISDEGGARGDTSGEPVPIVVAGGEYTVPPEVVGQIGGGNVDLGHKILDDFVLAVRKDHISTLKDLPPPAKK